MTASVESTSALARWIRHNLARGCKVDDIVAAMAAQRLDPELARGLVDAMARTLCRDPAASAHAPRPDESGAAYVQEVSRLPRGHVLPTHDREVPVLMRLDSPVVAVLGGVLSVHECETLVALARGRLGPSTVVDPGTGTDRMAEHRDSEGMFFALQETPFIARLDRRISELMNGPIENGEGLQVLRYGPGAKNRPHFDFLVPGNEANRASLARSGQRVGTLVVYLNDVPEGGETVFPELGLAITPRQGHAVYFEYANSQGQVDVRSVHAGAPVKRGEKWALTKWMRQRRFVPAAAAH